MTRTKNPALSLPASTRFTTRFVRFNCLACAASNLASCRLSGRERHGRVRKRGMTHVPAAGFISEKGMKSVTDLLDEYRRLTSFCAPPKIARRERVKVHAGKRNSARPIRDHRTARRWGNGRGLPRSR